MWIPPRVNQEEAEARKVFWVFFSDGVYLKSPPSDADWQSICNSSLGSRNVFVWQKQSSRDQDWLIYCPNTARPKASNELFASFDEERSDATGRPLRQTLLFRRNKSSHPICCWTIPAFCTVRTLFPSAHFSLEMTQRWKHDERDREREKGDNVNREKRERKRVMEEWSHQMVQWKE